MVLDDRRVNKMLLESTQILATSLILSGAPDAFIPVSKAGFMYRKTHERHPVVVWANSSSERYEWLLSHTEALANEFRIRFKKEHACAPSVRTLHSSVCFIKPGPLDGFHNCASNYKHIANVHDAYKLELMYKWLNYKEGYPPTWNNTQVFPGWP